MIQVNLLPDVKTKYIKAQRKKRLVILSSVVVSGVAIGILVIQIGIVYGAQKLQLSHYEDQNSKNIAKLGKIQDLNKMLTVQNQISKLNELHDAKPAVDRIFTYLPQIIPNDVKVNKLDFDVKQSTMTISGTASSMELLNKFVDTLKFTKVEIDGQGGIPAFTTVVLSNFSAGSAASKDASYEVTFKYDPSLFVSSKKTQLVVPKIITTRSETERPNPLFGQQEGK